MAIEMDSGAILKGFIGLISAAIIASVTFLFGNSNSHDKRIERIETILVTTVAFQGKQLENLWAMKNQEAKEKRAETRQENKEKRADLKEEFQFAVKMIEDQHTTELRLMEFEKEIYKERAEKYED